jgi:concentrative nucleoside transporter, CNT family
VQSLLGIVVFVAVAWLISNDRRSFPWRIVLIGLGLQWAFALVILKTELGLGLFEQAQNVFNKLLNFSDQGAIFLFGDEFSEHFFAFKVLPTIIFFSALSAILFHWRIIQGLVQVLAMMMKKSMGISGTESLVAVANVFCGQTESPLLIRPYIATMTRSEIMTMMTSGMATVAGGVMAAYVGFGISAGHLLAASLMSAPAAVVIAKIMYPENEISQTFGNVELELNSDALSTFEAACNGATEGLRLALNVGAMLIAFIALIGLANELVARMSGVFGYGYNLEQLLGLIFQPFAWLMGIAAEDTAAIGELLGKKMIINEFVAFMGLSEQIKEAAISPKSATIATYALCGFANFSSIAIQIGGIGALEPDRKRDFAAVGFRAMLGGTLACMMTGAVAALLL